MERSRARLNALRDENNEEMTNDMSTDEEIESKANEVSSDEDSHHSLELWRIIIIIIISQPHPPLSIWDRSLALYKIHGLQRDAMYCLKTNSSCDNKVWIFSWVLLGLHWRGAWKTRVGSYDTPAKRWQNKSLATDASKRSICGSAEQNRSSASHRLVTNELLRCYFCSFTRWKKKTKVAFMVTNQKIG